MRTGFKSIQSQEEQELRRKREGENKEAKEKSSFRPLGSKVLGSFEREVMAEDGLLRGLRMVCLLRKDAVGINHFLLRNPFK